MSNRDRIGEYIFAAQSMLVWWITQIEHASGMNHLIGAVIVFAATLGISCSLNKHMCIYVVAACLVVALIQALMPFGLFSLGLSLVIPIVIVFKFRETIIGNIGIALWFAALVIGSGNYMFR